MPAARVLAGRSIAIRLAASALFWSLLILLTAGLILSALYRDTTERAFDTRLLVYATDLASDLVTQGNPDQRELGTLGDPRFDLPLSGWYWQVGQPDARPRDLRSSRSLFGADPWPYGIAPNRKVLELFLSDVRDQGLTSRQLAVEELFASNLPAKFQ